MSWGEELWDQLDNIDKHIQWGTDNVEKYAKFVKERIEIEQIYVNQLRRSPFYLEFRTEMEKYPKVFDKLNLVKKFSAKQSKEEEMRYSSCLSFHTILNELHNYAGQREAVAQKMGDKVYEGLIKCSQDLRNDRKQYIQDARKAQQHIEQQSKQMETSKKKFEQDWREAEKLQLKFERADSSMNVTKADVEKAKNQLSTQLQVVEKSKNEYATQLHNFNEEQRKYFSTTVMQIFKNLQEMDERLSMTLGESFKSLGQLEQEASSANSKYFQGMVNAGNSVDAKKDGEMVVEMYKSGLKTPGDCSFEDFTQVSNRDRADLACSTNAGLMDKKVVMGTAKSKLGHWTKQIQIKALTPKTSLVSKEDYSQLPAEQRLKKLKQRIDQLYKELHVEMDYREGLMKMKEVYNKNPQLGDIGTLDTKISESVVTVDCLHSEILKSQKQLSELEMKQNAERKSCNLKANLYTPYGIQSPEKSIYEDIVVVVQQDCDDNHFENDNVNPPSLGRCRALYAFDGQSKDLLTVKANEMLHVIEKDKGDGWMRVRDCSGCEGFVPTSYMEIKNSVQ